AMPWVVRRSRGTAYRAAAAGTTFRLSHIESIHERSRLRREALAEGQQQPRQPLDSDAPAEQRPQQAPLFRQEAEPRLAVRGHAQVGLALVAVLHLQLAAPDRNGGLPFLLAREREVVDG